MEQLKLAQLEREHAMLPSQSRAPALGHLAGLEAGMAVSAAALDSKRSAAVLYVEKKITHL